MHDVIAGKRVMQQSLLETKTIVPDLSGLRVDDHRLTLFGIACTLALVVSIAALIVALMR